MSLFPDIWWQSPPPPSASGKADDSDDNDGGVRSRYPHRQFFFGNDRRRHDHEKNNGMKSSTTTDPNRNGTRKYCNNNNNDFDVGIRSCSYGSMHDDDNDDDEGVVAIRDEGETLLPVVYSPTLVDNDNSNNNNDNVQSDISSEDSCNNEYNDHDHDDDDDDDESIEIIEQPHRSMGLIFFDFIRCIAVSANVRCLNTQLMPIFMSLGGGAGMGGAASFGGDKKHPNNNSNQLDTLSVALRLFISLFSILLILVEFPDIFPFLQHAPPGPSSQDREPITTTSPPPPATTSTANQSLSSNNNYATTSSVTTTTTPPQLLPSFQSFSSPPTPPPPLYITNWIPRGIFYIFLAIICLEQSLVVRAFDNERHVNSYSRFFDGFFIVVSAYIMAATGLVYILLGMCCIQRIMERVRRDEKEKWRVYYEKVMEMELQDEEEEEEEEDVEEDEQDEERRKLMSSSTSLDWVKEEKVAHRRRKYSIQEEEDDETEKIHNIIGWVQWHCFGRCCWQRWLRWWRRNRWELRKNRRRRRRRQQHQWNDGCGLCQHLRCRTVDWRL